MHYLSLLFLNLTFEIDKIKKEIKLFYKTDCRSFQRLRLTWANTKTCWIWYLEELEDLDSA